MTTSQRSSVFTDDSFLICPPFLHSLPSLFVGCKCREPFTKTMNVIKKHILSYSHRPCCWTAPAFCPCHPLCSPCLPCSSWALPQPGIQISKKPTFLHFHLFCRLSTLLKRGELFLLLFVLLHVLLHLLVPHLLVHRCKIVHFCDKFQIWESNKFSYYLFKINEDSKFVLQVSKLEFWNVCFKIGFQITRSVVFIVTIKQIYSSCPCSSRAAYWIAGRYRCTRSRGSPGREKRSAGFSSSSADSWKTTFFW